MRSLITYWHIDGIMAIFLIAICIGYFYLTDLKWSKRSAYFFIGLFLIIISVASPLQFLGENYLMSAHMASHVLILLIAAPLFVSGIPTTTNSRFLILFSRGLSKHPWFPWMAGVCIMWFWHIPAIFNQVYNNPEQNGSLIRSTHLLQNAQSMSLVIAGILFSLPIVGPIKSNRMVPVNAVLYLSAACVFCSILGLLITFAPPGVYTHYAHITDHFGFLNMIRNENKISVLVDQQMAGLIMWVPGCLIYLTASMYLLMKWFRQQNDQYILINNQNES
jgi:putative membrane protein